MVEEGSPEVAEYTTWNSRFRALAESWGVTLPRGFYFGITLLSHMVTVDRFLRFSADLSWTFLGVVPDYRSARAITVRGWSTGYRLPKPDDLAIKSGSVFLYRYDGQDPDELLGVLAELERKGTGLRREEGFGQVAVSWPFHVELGGVAR